MRTINSRKFLCLAPAGFGLVAVVLILSLAQAGLARATPTLHCVNQTGDGCAAEYGARCYSSVQAAINAAATGDEIRIAGGTYMETGGTVAGIDKELLLVGSYNPSCSSLDPDMHTTTLDGQWGGPVVRIQNAGDVQLSHLTITHGDGSGICNPDIGCGGGIYAEDSTLHLYHSTVTDNIASQVPTYAAGGGIYTVDSEVEIVGSVISGNTAGGEYTTSYGQGGGIYILRGTARIAESSILDNIGSYQYSGSGGINLSQVSYAEILSNTIRGNLSTYTGNYWSGAGGIELSSSTALVSGNHIEQNGCSAVCYGGGIYIYLSSAFLENNHITRNNSGLYGSGGNGGGVSIFSADPSAVVTLTNNLIAGNSSGGGVYIERRIANTPTQFYNNTIANNTGEAIRLLDYADLDMANNLISGHTTGILTSNPYTGTVDADTNLFWNADDPITGANAILLEPRLRSDFYPFGGSPAIDAGLPLNWITRDLAGVARPQGAAWDIGAFEYLGDWLYLPLIRK